MAKKEQEIEKEQEVTGIEKRDSGIVINTNPLSARELPLIITLPATANKAQIERARVLNSYAYEHPIQWEQRKNALLKELENLKDFPVVENPYGPRLSVGRRLSSS